MIDYDKLIPEKVRNIKPSGIRKFFDVAQNIEGVISLGVGEPDFATPWSIRNTAIDTLKKGKTTYTANSGLKELRCEIAEYTKRNIGVEYNPDNEIIVTVGGSEAIDIAIRSLVASGDEVLIVEPCFVCYAPIVELSGGIPVPINTKIENNFKLMPEELKSKITEKTKILILPFPNNPTGAIMTREELEPIAEILRDTNILVLSDEIYAELTYGRKHFSIAGLEGMKERTILINGFSKAFAMTGWRLGYACGAEPVMSQLLKIHQYAIMCSPTMSQYAAVEALKNCESEVKKMLAEYDARRRLLVDRFNKLGLSCFNPEGAFYVFPCIRSTGLSSDEFCEKLLYRHKVAIVPGNAFGESGEGFIRVSYAYSLKHLFEALERIECFLKELREEQVTLRAYAKVNLSLDITGKLDNGYHTLESVFQSISIYDTVKVVLNNKGITTVSVDNPQIPSGENNIAYKAAAKFFEYTGLSGIGADIEIHKNIPSQAGLGGGSADAAAVLKALNIITKSGLSDEQLCDIGIKIGADVPFCICGGTAYVEGTGEKLTFLSPLSEEFICIAKGADGISTVQAYAEYDSCNDIVHPVTGEIIKAVQEKEFHKVYKSLGNVLEQAADIEDIGIIKRVMLENNALSSVMTGSGSAVCGIFANQDEAEECAGILRNMGFFAKECTFKDCGSALIT